jgi:ATP-dependent protease ClpP protease subunit
MANLISLFLVSLVFIGISQDASSDQPQITDEVSKVLHVDSSRTLSISGQIIDLNEEYSQLASFANESKEPIYILIDSPGGSVLAGIKFIQMMDRLKSEGIEIHCSVYGMAASMAMHIFGNCSHRYAFETSLLLWHPAYIFLRGHPVTEKEAKRLGTQLKFLTEILEKRLRKELALPDEVYDDYYYNEYFVSGGHLNSISPKFMKLIDNVKGQ